LNIGIQELKLRVGPQSSTDFCDITRIEICVACVIDNWHVLLFNLLYYYYLTAFFRTTWVNRHQKGKPFWILLEQEMMGWQWHQLDYVQVICTSLQRDNHASTSPLSFYRLHAMPFLAPNQQRQSTEGT